MLHRTTRAGVAVVFLLAPALPCLAADVVVTLGAGDGFVVENNDSTIERLRVDEATGNVSHNGALFVHTTGAGGQSLFVGQNSGNTSATGSYYNTGFGEGTLSSITTAYYNSAFGTSALTANTTGSDNAAFGYKALSANTSGYDNTAVGSFALSANTVGRFNTAVGQSALRSNLGGGPMVNNGRSNTAIGFNSMFRNDTGSHNTAVGYFSVFGNYGGDRNTGVGDSALRGPLPTGSNALDNAALGYRSLFLNTGDENSAFGSSSLEANGAGERNVAVGKDALSANTTGNDNIAVGTGAGTNQTTGSGNIYIGNVGVAAESGQIRIGTSGAHTDAFIHGIFGNTVSGSAVQVSSSGELGVPPSSRRFKEAIQPMGDDSRVLSELQPVTFRYREMVAGGQGRKQYGLIAEEVATLDPSLVQFDDAGEPFTVRYDFLAPMLLNEVQRQQQTIDELLARIERLEVGAPEPDAGAQR